MDILKELTYVVNRNKIKKIEILDLSNTPSSKLNQLYQSISTGKTETDEDAFRLLYPKAKSKGAYYNLKAVLKEKLLNTLFFIDAYQQEHNDRQSAFYEAYKDFAACQLLLAKNARDAGVELLEKVLRTAEHFEFTDLVIPVCRLLRLHYGTREGNEKKYEYYHELWRKYQDIDLLENQAEHYYTDLVLHYVNSKSTKEELRLLAHNYYQELAANLAQTPTYKFHFYTGLVQLYSYTCVNNYTAVLPICQELIQFFEQKPFAANTPIQIFLHHQLVAYLQLHDYERAQAVARRCHGLLEEGSFNWFKNLEYLFLLSMHSGKFQEAYEVFGKAVNHKRFAFLPSNTTEFWQLYQAYLHLLIELKKIQPEPGDSHFSTFRINRFLNEMPLYSKDKRGMNIAILIVHILFYILKGKYDTAIDRIEAIEKYCSRYLFKADTIRSYYFIKLLLVIPQAGFHRQAVIRYAATHLARLQSISTEISHQYHKIEILPYEMLWNLTINTLDDSRVNILKIKKRRKVRSEV